VVYKRNLKQLTQHASLHWTEELNVAASKETLLFDLLTTQDAFISILKVASKNPFSWLKILEETETLTLPLFTKHLMMLCDLGGETLNKILPISEYFPKESIEFEWNNSIVEHSFLKINQVKSLTNDSLKVTKKTINSPPKVELLVDLCMILLYGSQSINSLLPSEYATKAIIGKLLGNSEAIDSFFKENYIKVSTQIRGAQSNALGHFAQNFVFQELVNNLPDDWAVKLEGSLTGVQHIEEGTDETNFDITVNSPAGVQFGVEVSFQVTTNSTIERKARDSSAIMERVNKLGHFICYVLDGAGNINVRKKAIETICSHSNCTVALSKTEIQVLSSFMTENG
jgi:hypothetical protein